MKTKVILFSILILLLTGILTEWMGITISKNVLFQSCQSSEVKYVSGDPYCLRVVKLNQWIHSTTLILISKKNMDTNYGYALNFPTPNVISQEEFDKLKVEWTPEGVAINTYWNENIFIPAKNFNLNR